MSTSIDQAITDVSAQKGFAGEWATRVQRANHDVPMNRIALTVTALIGERRAAVARDEIANTTEAQDMPCKPAQVFSFLQRLTNKLTRNAHRAYFLALQSEAQDLAEQVGEEFGNGIDFTQDRIEELGHSASDTAELVKEQLDEDFQCLLRLHAYCSKFFRGLDIDPLFMLENSEPDEMGNWIRTHAAMTWDESMAVRAELIEQWEKQEAAEMEKAGDIDFSSDEPIKPAKAA